MYTYSLKDNCITVTNGETTIVQDKNPNTQQYFQTPDEAILWAKAYIASINDTIDETPYIDKIRQNKINELQLKCQNTMYNSFKSSCLGEEKTFNSDLLSQQYILSMVTLAALIKNKIIDDKVTWRDANSIKCFEFTPDQMIQLGLDLKNFIETNNNKLSDFIIYIQDPNRTEQEILELTWDSVLPQ